MKLNFTPTKIRKSEFVTQFGGVYEHSAWIAEGVYENGLRDDMVELDIFCAILKAVVEQSGCDAQLTLLSAHPDLAGKLAVAGTLTAESTSEQTSAGLDQCSAEEFAELTSLNTRYKTRFGFPFILAVRGRNRQEILKNFRSRINNSNEIEFREALDQVHQIARLRLTAMC